MAVCCSTSVFVPVFQLLLLLQPLWISWYHYAFSVRGSKAKCHRKKRYQRYERLYVM